MVFNSVSDSAGGDGKGFVLLPRGEYTLKLIDLQIKDGQYGPQVKWVFNVAGVDGKPILNNNGQPMELWQFTSKNINLHPLNKTRPWLEAFAGRKLREGESGDEIEREVLGKKAKAYITQQPAKTNPQKVYNVVQDMYAIETVPSGATEKDSTPLVGQAGGMGSGLAAAVKDQDEIPF